MELILKRRYATLEYSKENNRIYLVWHGFATTDEFKHVVDLIVEWVRKHRIRTLWSDSSTQEVVSQEGAVYCVEKTLKMYHYGLRFNGIIQPQDEFNSLVFQTYVEAMKGSQVAIGHFSTGEEVEDWLDQSLLILDESEEF